MKKWKVLFAIGCGLIVAGSGGGGSAVTPADFSGTWNGSYGGTAFAYSIAQTGSNFNMTRTSPALAGVAYTGVVTGNSAFVTTYINSISSGTSTLALVNNTTATMTVNTCTPPSGYSCAAPGTALNLTRVTGGGSASSSAPTSLSADRSVFESLYLNPSASYSPIWSLPPSSGAPITGTDYFYTHAATINASPLTAGPQTISSGQNFSIASTLAIPATTSATRYLVAGRIYADTTTTERFSYQNSDVKDELLTSDGTVLYANLRSGFQSVPLTGLMVSSPVDFAHWFNALFTNPSLLSSTATWGAGSAYIEYIATKAADQYRVFDYSTSTTGTAPSPVATGTTIAALMAAGGITSSSDGATYTLANGAISSINGVITYVATTVRRNQTTDLYRTYYELNGNVYTGDLTRTGTVLGGNSYLVTANGIVNYSAKYQIRINKAAVDSIKAAVTF